jgi:hypothetical protein
MATALTSSISEGSRSDYTLHAIQDDSGDPCVVIIEAKLKMTVHSTAQAIGYFLATGSSVVPPLVLVIDKQYIQILLFPFKEREHQLVNCLVIPQMRIFVNGNLNQGLFEIILRLSAKNCRIDLDYSSIDNFKPIQAKKMRTVCTVTDQFKYYRNLHRKSVLAKATLEEEYRKSELTWKERVKKHEEEYKREAEQRELEIARLQELLDQHPSKRKKLS